MNKIYKVVWNKARNCYVVASEFAKNHQTGSSRIKAASVAAVMAAAMLTAAGADIVYASSSGGNEPIQFTSPTNEKTGLKNPDLEHINPLLGDRYGHTDTCGERIDNTTLTIGDINKVTDDLVYNDDLLYKQGIQKVTMNNGTISLIRNDNSRVTDSIALTGNGGKDGEDTSVTVTVGKQSQKFQTGSVVTAEADDSGATKLTINGKSYDIKAGKHTTLVDGENTKAKLVKDDATGTQYKVDVDLSKYAKTEDVAVVYDKDKTSLRSTNATVKENAIALGKGASAVKNSIAIGNGAYTQDGTLTRGQSVALGNGAVTGAKSTSIGSNAVGGREGTITIGANANNGSLYATVIGTDSKVNYMTRNSGAAATIVGAKSEIKNDNKSYSGVANGIFGSANTIENSNGVTIQGSGNTVTNAYKNMSGWDFNLGGVSVKKDAGAVGVIGGMNTVSNQIYTNVIGFGNTVAGDTDNISHDVFVAGSRNNLSKVSDSIVMGNDNKISDRSNVISLGHENNITANNAVAIGNGAGVSAEGGVALGVGSVANRAAGKVVGYDPTTGKAYDIENGDAPDYVWKATKGAVSVGDTENNITRQITNVAAGTGATDAVNVAQLKAATENAGWNLSTGKEITNPTKVKSGATVDFSGDDGNITVSKEETDYATLVNVKLNRNLNVDSVQAGDFFMNNDKGIGYGGEAYVTRKGLNANDKVITNVAKGVYNTDAVNVGQLKEVEEVAANANKGWNLSTNGVATSAINVTPGGYVDFSGDKNISVSHDGTNVKVELNKNIDVNSVQTNALNSKYNLSVGTMAENGIMPFLVNSTGAFYAANNNFSVDKDGKVIATAGEIGNVVLQNGVYTGKSALRDGELYLGDASGNYSQITTTGAKLGQVTIAADGKISGVAAGEVSSTSTDAINGSQLQKVSDTANAGWNLSTNGVATEATNVKPGESVDFSGDKNISVSHDGTKVKVELNKNIDVNSVQTNALNSKYNLSVGTMAENGIMPFLVNSTGAFYAANNNFSVDKDGKVIATAGEIGNVVLQNGVYTGKSALRDGELYLGDASGNYSQITTTGAKLGQVTIAADGKISGVAAGEVSSTSTDAINGSQLQKVSDTANAGWNLSTNGVATEATNVKPGESVDFSGDKNISVSHDGTKVKVELNKNIDVNSVQTNALNSKYNLSVGTMAENGIMPFLVNSTGAFYAANNNFSVDKDGKVIATAGEIGNVVLQNGVYTGKSALRDGELYLGDASGNYSQITTTGAKLGQVTIAADGKISGVAAGEVSSTSTDAINGSQLQKVSDTANAGWNLSTNGVATEATNVKPGESVDFSGDKNISVSHDGTKVKVELNKNIDVNSVQTNALNSKYNLSVGTMAENGIMPFLVNSTGAFYAANNNFSVDKDGKVIATAGEIGNVVLQNGVYTGKSALRDGELYLGDASGNYSQITTTGAKLGQVTIAADGKISGVAAGEVSSTSTDAINGSQLHAVATEAGKHTTLSNGKNTTVESTVKDGQTDYKVNVAGDLTDITSVANGDSKINLNKDSIIISNGNKYFAITNSGIGMSYIGADYSAKSIMLGENGTTISGGLNVAGSKITGVAAGTADEDAVNVSQLKDVELIANKGWNLTTAHGKTTTVKPGDTVDFSPEDTNLTVTNEVTNEGTNVKIGLNKVLHLTSATFGDTIINANGLTIGHGTAGLEFSQNRVSVGGQQIHDVADGKDNTDAVNVRQLKQVADAATSNDKRLVQNPNDSDGSYQVKENGDVTLRVEDSNKNGYNVTIKDVASKAELDRVKTDVGNVDGFHDEIKNKDTNGKPTHTSVVDAVNNLDTKVNTIQSDVTKATEEAKKHSSVSTGNGLDLDVTDNNGQKDYKVSLKDDFTLGGKDGHTGSIEFKGSEGNITASGTLTANAVSVGNTSISDTGLQIGNKTSLTEDALTIGGNTYITDKGIDANQQKISNVADGDISKDSKDAVNGSQLYATNEAIANNYNNITNLNGRISNLDNRVNKVGAGAAALAALHPLDFDPDAKWDFAAGYGNYRGANAAAVGAYYRPNEDTMFSVGGTFGNGENMVNAGVSFKLGSGSSHVSTSRVAMAKEIKELRGELEAMKSAMLDANAGKKIDTSKLQLFPDVPQNHWAYEYVAQLAGNGMIEGYPDGNFAGDRPMTRYEFAAILYRAMTKGAVLSDKILSEFSHELEYFTVDTIAKDKAGNPTIQRVRTVKENKNK